MIGVSPTAKYVVTLGDDPTARGESAVALPPSTSNTICTRLLSHHKMQWCHKAAGSPKHGLFVCILASLSPFEAANILVEDFRIEQVA